MSPTSESLSESPPQGPLESERIISHSFPYIPLNSTKFNLKGWENSFRSWSTALKGRRDWFNRVDSQKRTVWIQAGISKALELSLVLPSINEYLLVAACQFWSSSLNAFLFPTGPIGPTLLDMAEICCFCPDGAILSAFEMTARFRLQFAKQNECWMSYMKR